MVFLPKYFEKPIHEIKHGRITSKTFGKKDPRPCHVIFIKFFFFKKYF